MDPLHAYSPSPEAVVLARQASQVFRANHDALASVQTLSVTDSDGTVHSHQVPAAAFRLLLDILSEMGRGNAVTLVPVHAELNRPGFTGDSKP